MKLTFLGSGGAFTMKNWHSNMLLEVSGHRLLIDCGTDIRFSLREANIDVQSIDGVYISHCHADHAGGVEYFAFQRYFAHARTPTLFGHAKVIDTLWNNTLKGGMGILERNARSLSDYFKLNNDQGSTIVNDRFVFGGLTFDLVRTIHIQDDYETMPSFGLFIREPKVFITTDTKYDPYNLAHYYDRASTIFQDCETFDMSGQRKSGVHAHYTELLQLRESVRNKMALYHYSDGVSYDPTVDGFIGFVKKGQVFEF